MADKPKPKPKPKPPVGYGRPPVEQRFQKGTSGNPKGRPKKTPQQRADQSLMLGYQRIFMEESEREITITENGKAETLSVFRAAVRRMHLEAVKGVASAAAKVLKMRQDTEQSTHALKVEYLVAILQCKVDWAEIVEECKRANRPLPKTLAPHPDDIVINQATMAIRFNGPEDPEAQRHWDHNQQLADQIDADARSARAAAKRWPDSKAMFQAEADQCAKMAARLRAFFPNEETRRRYGFDLEEWRRTNPLCQELAEMGKRVRKTGDRRKNDRRSRRL